MKIIKKSKSIHVKKPEGTIVDYYIFKEYELHYNEIAPGTTQPWHHHQTISETVFIITGQIEVHWIENDNKQKQLVGGGDVVEVENTPHTFVNSSNQTVKLIVFRFVPTGEDKREIIKNDKVLDKLD